MFASGRDREKSTERIASILDEEGTSGVTLEPNNVSDTEGQHSAPNDENAQSGYQARSDYVTKEPAPFSYQNLDPTIQVGWPASRNAHGVPTTYANPSEFSNQDVAQPRNNTSVEYLSPYSSLRGQNTPSGFGFYPAQARSPSLVARSPPVPNEALENVPRTSFSRPKSMISCEPKPYSRVPPSGVEETISYNEDLIDDVIRNIASSNISESDSEIPVLYDAESVGKATGDISRSKRPSYPSGDRLSIQGGQRRTSRRSSEGMSIVYRPISLQTRTLNSDKIPGEDQESEESTSDKPSLTSMSMTQISSTALPSGRGLAATDTKRWTASAPSKSSPGEFQQEFKLHKSKDYRKGRVFKVLWSEPVGAASSSSIEKYGDIAKFGERVYHSIRRFVIVKERPGHCLCIPILTYSGQGTAKRGVKAEHHAIIYSTETVPELVEGEPRLYKKPIRVELVNRRDSLDHSSRVNYTKVYTVEHNVKVYFIGRIHAESEAEFFADFKAALEMD